MVGGCDEYDGLGGVGAGAEERGGADLGTDARGMTGAGTEARGVVYVGTEGRGGNGIAFGVGLRGCFWG
jgi:hypothetical protein